MIDNYPQVFQELNVIPEQDYDCDRVSDDEGMMIEEHCKENGE